MIGQQGKAGERTTHDPAAEERKKNSTGIEGMGGWENDL